MICVFVSIAYDCVWFFVFGDDFKQEGPYDGMTGKNMKVFVLSVSYVAFFIKVSVKPIIERY